MKQSFKNILKRLNSERGSALVMVLGVMSVCVVMVAHVVAVSGTLGKEALQTVSKDSLRYQAESAADVAFWMHLNDRRQFHSRTLGQTADDEFRASADFPPWMLDGRPHDFDDGQCVVYMQSGENGFDLTNPQNLKQVYDMDDTAAQELVDEFIDALEDYTDEDDFVKLNGLENNDYVGMGFPTLPRNGAMEFAAEVYWIPGWRDAIPGEIRLLPPNGVDYRSSEKDKASFFSASIPDLIIQLDVDEGELQQILDARQRWLDGGELLEDTLDIDILTKIKSKFSFDEAKLGAFYAVAYNFDRSAHLVYRIVRICDISQAAFFGDSHRETLSIWERSGE